jgi:NADH-quinone oxidoreductase subunit A|tara:strand:- start:9221 stop:9634 length:414 start_codon:yes stop_codon:yes gene_type:complete
MEWWAAFVSRDMTQELADYLPVLVQVLLALFIAGAVLLVSHLMGQRGPTNKFKDSAYECGVAAEGTPGARFSIKFYVTAMLFILFDIEVVFLIPWVLIYRDFLSQGLPIFFPIMAFLGVLVVGLYYELKKGALDWEK